MSSSIKQQLINDLQMSGLACSSQKIYLEIVVRFVKQTRIRPQDATEAQVADYLRGLIRDGKCQGTIAPVRGALRFVFENTLGRQWGLFKKGSARNVASDCPRPRQTPSVAASSLPFTGRNPVSAWL
jgi:hypothetical protein